MKILVTGGAGFIGSAVVRNIIDNTQDEVRVLDSLTYAGNLESLSSVVDNERYSFSCTDITDAIAVATQFSEFQPDIVMHLAAESHVDRSIDGPAAFIQTNLVGTFILLEAARNYWSSWILLRKIYSGFIIYLQTKFMVTLMVQMPSLQRKHHMRQVVHILPLKLVAII